MTQSRCQSANGCAARNAFGITRLLAAHVTVTPPALRGQTPRVLQKNPEQTNVLLLLLSLLQRRIDVNKKFLCVRYYNNYNDDGDKIIKMCTFKLCVLAMCGRDAVLGAPPRAGRQTVHRPAPTPAHARVVLVTCPNSPASATLGC